VALFDGIGVDWFTGAAQFAISETGTLAYVPGTHEVPNNTLAFVDREGRERPLPTPARPFMNLALTSDGSRVAATIHEGTGSDIWVSDTARGALGRLTFEAHNIEPVFTPDGKRVTFASSRSGPYNIFWLPADGGGAVEALLTSPRNQYPESWSPDGRTLLFTELHPETGSDLWVLTLGERQPKPLLVTRFDESAAAFSPDGRSIAYVSNETGRHEVFVHPYPASGPRWRVSTDGGAWPFWSTDGRELYYLTDDTCMAVEVAGGAEPSFTSPQPLFPARDIVAAAAAPGGRGFIVVRGPGAAAPVQVNLVLGWLSELSRLAPGGS
jgi:Tol biopolymer transport system component